MTCRLESSALFEMQREEELCQDDILSLEPQVRMVIKWVKKTVSITLAAQRRNPPQDQAWISLLNAFSRYQKFYCGLYSAYSSWPLDWQQQIQQVSQNRFFFFGYISILQSVQWYFLDTYYDGSVVESFYVSMDDNISGKMNDDSSVFAQCICTYTYNSLEAKNTYSPYSLHSVVIIHTCILYT